MRIPVNDLSNFLGTEGMEETTINRVFVGDDITHTVIGVKADSITINAYIDVEGELWWDVYDAGVKVDTCLTSVLSTTIKEYVAENRNV